LFVPYIKRSSRVLSFTLAAAATVAGTALARAGASDFDQASLLGSSAAAKLKPLDPRLRAQVSEQPGVEQQTEQLGRTNAVR